MNKRELGKPVTLKLCDRMRELREDHDLRQREIPHTRTMNPDEPSLTMNRS